MNNNGRELIERLQRQVVEQVHREALARMPKMPPTAPPEPQTIDCTELPEAKPESELYHEWNFYRRQVVRLLAEGHEGQFVLIKGEQIIGIWDTHDEVYAVALQKYLKQPCLIHQVQRREPLVRLSARFRRCQS